MRELNVTEFEFVSGGDGVCTADEGGNTYGGVSEPSSIGRDLIAFYEGLIEATSYMIERVANAL